MEEIVKNNFIEAQNERNKEDLFLINEKIESKSSNQSKELSHIGINDNMNDINNQDEDKIIIKHVYEVNNFNNNRNLINSMNKLNINKRIFTNAEISKSIFDYSNNDKNEINLNPISSKCNNEKNKNNYNGQINKNSLFTHKLNNYNPNKRSKEIIKKKILLCDKSTDTAEIENSNKNSVKNQNKRKIFYINKNNFFTDDDGNISNNDTNNNTGSRPKTSVKRFITQIRQNVDSNNKNNLTDDSFRKKSKRIFFSNEIQQNQNNWFLCKENYFNNSYEGNNSNNNIKIKSDCKNVDLGNNFIHNNQLLFSPKIKFDQCNDPKMLYLFMMKNMKGFFSIREIFRNMRKQDEPFKSKKLLQQLTKNPLKIKKHKIGNKKEKSDKLFNNNNNENKIKSKLVSIQYNEEIDRNKNKFGGFAQLFNKNKTKSTSGDYFFWKKSKNKKDLVNMNKFLWQKNITNYSGSLSDLNRKNFSKKIQKDILEKGLSNSRKNRIQSSNNYNTFNNRRLSKIKYYEKFGNLSSNIFYSCSNSRGKERTAQRSLTLSELKL